jgi:HAD superfamily hydrolase (TIGR01509 family)
MKLKLPDRNFGAYLFDCDGTIVDSMPLHYLAWRKVLADHGCDFNEKLFYAWGGMPTAEIVATLNTRHGLQMAVEAVCDEKENLYYEMLPQLKAVPEVLEHIEEQHGRIPFAVVSGGTRESVLKSLTILGLAERFQTLVCAGEYVKGKPDPEPFLLAAERLGVRARDCLVFEDTEMGIAAAKAAGMDWVKVPAPWERNVSV